ncbi:spore cortex-lytic enzyme [Paenibacillus paeoniae]|uniref:Spore cortex-lytic enzyme n=1 Tax=Paenibacillus paeoniae TaxID=2292705 RepID=A0A371PK39_9BACL|nr:spore cortex-lytic enzyme [Paenibacillus paeoniae]REK76568.1 spore cortex-lytic enzyme [Paenibacillus paeoniae]
MRNRLLAVTLIIVLLVCGTFSLFKGKSLESAETFSNATLKVGSTGQDVHELQGRLTFLGFYNGKIDGVFGSKTKGAVTWFQWKFGLKSDGLVGADTKKKLVNATKAWKPGGTAGGGSGGAPSGGSSDGGGAGSGSNLAPSNKLGLSENDIQIMANAVYGEARGEPYEGQVAVAAVILNRVKSPSFPDSVYGVIFQPRAFTAVADGQIYLTPNARARDAVMDAINGSDPSGGCLYYFNPVTATSAWIWTRPQVKTIGKHIFCM